jgi:hypothetical protein
MDNRRQEGGGGGERMVLEPKARTVQDTRRNDTNTKTVQLAELLTQIGPDINEISRRLGQFKESVRYRYTEKILGKGFTVQASVNYEKLGLRRVVLLADFAGEYSRYAHAILSAMNELCYVVYFEKRMFSGDYLIEASVPSEHVGAFMDFMAKLRDKGVFRNLEMFPFSWFRTIPMHARSYDFDTGRWDFDWSAPQKFSEEAAYSPSEKVKFDRVDLFILKELQIDATKELVDIARKLKENYKTLTWHHRTHVLHRGMINGYYLRWMGTSYSTTLERALHRMHRYHHVALLATGLQEVERMNLAAKLHSIPFLWSETVGQNEYCGHFYFPMENVTEAYQFITRSISDIKDRVRILALDQTEALSFTLSYQLFDDESQQWSFNEPGLLARFDGLIAKIEEVGGV